MVWNDLSMGTADLFAHDFMPGERRWLVSYLFVIEGVRPGAIWTAGAFKEPSLNFCLLPSLLCLVS